MIYKLKKKCIFSFSRIEDPDEAQDHFIVARSNCKEFAFVHIAHAQFEVSQGTCRQAYLANLESTIPTFSLFSPF